WKKGKSILSASGYQQYEISSYAKKGYYCQHNLNYWHYDDYLGIGCGAHGKLTQKNGNIIRMIKNKSSIDYLNGQYTDKIFLVKDKDKPFEYFINNLRLFKPISHKHFIEHTNINIESIRNNINNAILEGYLIETPFIWNTTKKGKLFLNSLLELFLN
ncbi:MAG TPA: YggW family oxidoreductase, partial [Buchnera sp. (in: enterobacteria)]|nr:YggW family oxidoreductase [Buchnera sp. (in: enterobacteria)]